MRPSSKKVRVGGRAIAGIAYFVSYKKSPQRGRLLKGINILE
jgi:hypothetical protein